MTHPAIQNESDPAMRRAFAAIDEAAKKAVDATADKLTATYDRMRDLPNILGIKPEYIAAQTDIQIIALIEIHLRQSHMRQCARHWTFDHRVHLALVTALRAERAEIARLGA